MRENACLELFLDIVTMILSTWCTLTTRLVHAKDLKFSLKHPTPIKKELFCPLWVITCREFKDERHSDDTAHLRQLLTVCVEILGLHGHISWPGRETGTFMQVRRPDIKVRSWRGCVLSAVVRPAGPTAKILETDRAVTLSFNSHFNHFYS